jgi:drug/metabolite transporter (DMT)-like permease
MKVGFALALVIAVTGQVLYHVTQKNVSAGTHPVVSLIAFYVIAALLSLPLLWLFPLKAPLLDELRLLNGAVYGVAVSIVLIELGFLLAYRAGGSLSSSFVLTASVVTTSLLLIGTVAYKESISVAKLAGIGMCLAGIWLITRRAT